MLLHVITYSCISLTFPFWRVTKKYSTKLSHVPQPRPFILNGLSYIHKISLHHINKTTSAELLLIRLINFSASISMCILKINDPPFSWGPGVGWLQFIHTSHHYPTWLNLLPAKIWLNVMSSSHNSVCCLNPQSYFCSKTSVRFFRLL